MTALLLPLIAMALDRPTEASCPVGYFVNGTPPSGITTCLEAPPLDVCNTRGGCDSEWRGKSVAIRVWCLKGMEPRVIDERRIACR